MISPTLHEKTLDTDAKRKSLRSDLAPEVFHQHYYAGESRVCFDTAIISHSSANVKRRRPRRGAALGSGAGATRLGSGGFGLAVAANVSMLLLGLVAGFFLAVVVLVIAFLPAGTPKDFADALGVCRDGNYDRVTGSSGQLPERDAI
jgi:hypothetical protein